MGEAARRRVGEYDIEVYVDKLGAIYDRIIAQGPRRGRKSPEMEEASEIEARAAERDRMRERSTRSRSAGVRSAR